MSERDVVHSSKFDRGTTTNLKQQPVEYHLVADFRKLLNPKSLLFREINRFFGDIYPPRRRTRPPRRQKRTSPQPKRNK